MAETICTKGIIVIVGDPAMVERAIAKHHGMILVEDDVIRLGNGGVPLLDFEPPMTSAIKAPRDIDRRNPLNPKQAMRANRRGRGKRRK